MSLIGLLTATEKQVHLDRLHMRPIQWHLKNNWRVPESLQKVIPLPRSLHPHLRWWLEEMCFQVNHYTHENMLCRYLQTHQKGWGAHKCTARGTWSLPESKLYINHLALKEVFLALNSFKISVQITKSWQPQTTQQWLPISTKRGGAEVGLPVCPTGKSGPICLPTSSQLVQSG